MTEKTYSSGRNILKVAGVMLMALAVFQFFTVAFMETREVGVEIGVYGIQLIVGLISFLYANKPERAFVCMAFTVLLVVAGIFQIIIEFEVGLVISFAFAALCLYGAMKNRADLKAKEPEEKTVEA